VIGDIFFEVMLGCGGLVDIYLLWLP